MSKVLPPVGGEVQEIEDGTYPATCFSVDDDEPWPAIPEGQLYGPKPERPAVRVTLVVDDVLNQDGTNVMVSKKVTRSAHEQSTLSAWASILVGVKKGEAFDTDDMVGKRALIEVSHTDSGYPTISNMTALPKSMQKTKAGVGG
jgi:hypothetical protein